MVLSVLRIGFAVVWFQLAVGLLWARATATGHWKERLNAQTVDLAIVVLFALAVWNLARWWVGRRRPTRPTRWPVRGKR